MVFFSLQSNAPSFDTYTWINTCQKIQSHRWCCHTCLKKFLLRWTNTLSSHTISFWTNTHLHMKLFDSKLATSVIELKIFDKFVGLFSIYCRFCWRISKEIYRKISFVRYEISNECSRRGREWSTQHGRYLCRRKKKACMDVLMIIAEQQESEREREKKKEKKKIFNRSLFF